MAPPGAFTLITWALWCAVVPLAAGVAWGFFVQLRRIERGRTSSFTLEIVAILLAIAAAVLLWLGAGAVAFAYAERTGERGSGVLQSKRLEGKFATPVADVEFRGAVRSLAVTRSFWDSAKPGSSVAVYYDRQNPSDFVARASDDDDALRALAALAALGAVPLALLFGSVRSVQLALETRRKRPRTQPTAPPRAVEPPPKAVEPPKVVAPPPPPTPVAARHDAPPPPDPTVPAWVMVAGNELARAQREPGHAPSWVTDALAGRAPGLVGRELGDCILVQFGALGPDEVAVVVERVAPDRRVLFESFRRMPRAEFERFGVRL